MKLILRKRAFKAILAVAKWVDDQNTAGAGDRWLQKVFQEFNRQSKAGVRHAVCKNELLTKYKYLCFVFNNNWTVAYRIYRNQFIVCRFIWSAKLE